jgi:hypothetical protein
MLAARVAVSFSSLLQQFDMQLAVYICISRTGLTLAEVKTCTSHCTLELTHVRNLAASTAFSSE